MSNTELLELAERCEKATGPDRELDYAVDAALGAESWRFAPAVTASIDAAMTLVPEGFKWEAGTMFAPADATVEAKNYKPDTYNGISEWCQAATPALALCAAALKARASQ